MENQLHTQEQLNRVRSQIKDNLNYIYIVLMILANALLSLLQIKSGEIGLNYPSSGLGWLLWATQVLAVTFIGVMILNSFRRQGIKNGHASIKDDYTKYIDLLSNQTNQSTPRSLKEYLNQRALNDSLFKGTIFAAINILVISLSISANFNSLMALVINVILAICFGIKAMLDAEDFVITELIVWYKIEILKMEKEKSNGRNQKPRTRLTKSSGIQQTKEFNTGRTATKHIITN